MEIDRSRSNKVVLDTNALLSIEELKMDILEELRGMGYKEFIVPSPVLLEIKKISGGRSRASIAARIALKFIERLRVVETGIKNADESVIDVARSENAVIFTNDKRLRAKAENQGIPVIYIRNLKVLKEKG